MPELIGLDTKVNTTVEGDQLNPRIASNGQGVTIVAWESLEGPAGIYAQRYDSAGNPVGDELAVATASNLENPALAIALDGSFVIAWEQTGPEAGIFFQRYDSAGTPVGEPVASSLTSAGNEGAFALDGDGNIVLVGAQGNGTNAVIVAQRYNVENELTEAFEVSTGGVNAANPTIAMAPNGNFVITWEQVNPGNGGAGRDIFARRFNADGAIDESAFQVNTTTQANQEKPIVAIAPDGSTFSISWESGGGNAFGGLYAQRYEFNPRQPIGDEIKLDPEINAETKAVAISPDGTLAIAYSNENNPQNSSDIFVKRYSRDGTLLNPEETAPINEYTQGIQSSAAIAPNAQGDFIIVWQSESQDGSGYGIYSKGLSAGVSEGEEPEEEVPTLAELIITPTEDTLELAEGSSSELYSVVLSRQPTGNVTISFDTDEAGIEPLEDLVFTPDNWDQAQTVTVTAIADEIAQGDRLVQIRPQATSTDPDYGGRDFDPVGVTVIDVPPPVIPGEVELIQPIGSTHIIQGFGWDPFKIVLSRQPTDTVTITAELPDNLLTLAHDSLRADSTTEHSGTTTYSITFTPQNWNLPQTITLSALDVPVPPSRSFQHGNPQVGINYAVESEDPAYQGLSIDPFSLSFSNTNNTGIEETLTRASAIGLTRSDDRITGSPNNDIIHGREGNDIISGIGGDNVIYGQGGNDGIEGGAGQDIIFGGSGNDHLHGLAGDDVVYGGEGSDRLYGGDGNDMLFGGEGSDRLFGGLGRDTLTGGPSRDSFGIGVSTGAQSVEEADLITDFTKDEDIIEFVGDLTFGQLEIYQGSDAYATDTILRDRQTGEYYARLQNVLATSLDSFDFV